MQISPSALNYSKKAINFAGYYSSNPIYSAYAKNQQFDDFIEESSILDFMDRQSRSVSDECSKEAAKQQKNISKLFADIKIKNETLKNSEIGSIRQVGQNNAYTGSMRDAALNVGELKKRGIKRVVAFCRPEETTIEQACKKNGIKFEYFYCPEIQDIMNTERCRKQVTKEMKGSFRKLVETLRKGDCIIGCETGNQRTGIMCGILSMLDPKTNLKVSEAHIPDQSKIFGKWVFESLSDVDKKALGYTKAFNDKITNMLKCI